MTSARLFVVTGAGRGIGRDVCKLLVSRGHRVLAAVRCIDDVALLQFELGESSEVTQCDVREAHQVERLFLLADERFGRVDGLVNNAATIQPIGRIADTPAGEWKQALLANLYGPYLCIAAHCRA